MQVKTWQLWILLICCGVGFLSVSTPVYAAVTCDSFTVDSATAEPGDFVTLTWTSTDATEATIDVIGPVATTGSMLFEIPYSPGLFTFNLDLTGGSIFEPETAFCSTNITIEGPPVCDLFTATPDTLTEPGNVTLTWETSFADTSVTIDNGVGVVLEDDSVVVSVTGDTTYTLTAVGSFGSTQCTAPVTFVAPTVPSTRVSTGGGKSINPKCELFVDKKTVTAGETVTVSWKHQNTESLRLMAKSAGASQLLFEASTAEALKLNKTSFVVTDDTVFDMVVQRPYRSGDCSVAVSVVKDDGLAGAGLGDATSLIALANVPETGFSPTAGFAVLLNIFLAFGAALVAYVTVILGQLVVRATSRSHHVSHQYTPQTVRFSRERVTLYSRLLLWQWLAAILVLVMIGRYWWFL